MSWARLSKGTVYLTGGVKGSVRFNPAPLSSYSPWMNFEVSSAISLSLPGGGFRHISPARRLRSASTSALGGGGVDVEMLGAQHAGRRRERQRALDDVAKLTHVARPAVGREPRQRVGSEHGRLAVSRLLAQ